MIRRDFAKTSACIVSAVMGLLSVPPAQAQDKAPGTANSAEPVAPAASPLTFAQGSNSSGWLSFDYFAETRIFIPVVVNGKPVMAMLDSGASETVLDKTFAISAGLAPQGNFKGEGGGGSTAYAVAKGVDLKLGDLSWNGGSAVVIDLAAVEKQVGHATPVILGGEFFKRTIVDIDFRAQKIAFHDPDTFAAPANATVVPLTASGENQAIMAKVEGRPAKLLFDLGNAGAIDLFPRFWEKPEFEKGRPTSTTFVGGVGGMSVQKIAMIGTVDLGGARFAHVPSRLEDSPSSKDAASGLLDGNIGMGVLNRFHLIIDFPHQKVLFAPPVDKVTPFHVNHSGLTLQPGIAGSKVLHVAAGSPADLAGLAVGDIIIAVNEQVTSQATSWQYGPVGQVIRLGLGDGTIKTLTLATYF